MISFQLFYLVYVPRICCYTGYSTFYRLSSEDIYTRHSVTLYSSRPQVWWDEVFKATTEETTKMVYNLISIETTMWDIYESWTFYGYFLWSRKTHTTEKYDVMRYLHNLTVKIRLAHLIAILSDRKLKAFVDLL